MILLAGIGKKVTFLLVLDSRNLPVGASEILIPQIVNYCYLRDSCIYMCAYLLHVSFVFLRLLIVVLHHSQSNSGNTMAMSGL